MAGTDPGPAPASTERKLPRVKEVLTAYIDVAGKQEAAVGRDFTENGLFLQTPHLLEEGSPIAFEVEHGGTSIFLEGSVVAVRRAGAEPRSAAHAGMGIRLRSPPPEYRRLVEEIRGGRVSELARRKDPRVELFHRVRYASGDRFLAEYCTDLGKGGLYLATGEGLAPGSTLRIELEIPGVAEAIEIRGRVAYRLSPEKARAIGKRSGAGIQFVELASEAKGILAEHLSRVRTFRRKFHRRGYEEVPPAGSMGRCLAPELLLHFGRRRATGLLTLEREGAIKIAYLKQGRPVYVESSLPAESLGEQLVEKGLLTPADLEISLKEHSRNDLHHGEILMRGGMLGGPALAAALLETHEARLMNVFGWFDGRYAFTPNEEFPDHLASLPLRAYRIVFSGIRRWYDPALIRAWMGLRKESRICRLSMPRATSLIPPGVIRILKQLSAPKTVDELCAALKAPEEVVVPVLFAAVLAGWAAVETAVPAVRRSREIERGRRREREARTGPRAGSAREAEILLAHERMSGQSFYDLLGATRGMHETVLTRKFMEASRRVGLYREDARLAPEVRGRIDEMARWLRTAFEVLRTPALRKLYARRGQPRRSGESREDRAAADRRLFEALCDLALRDLAAAIAKLTQASAQFPEDAALAGHLGWALFQEDPERNAGRAAELIDAALAKDDADPELHYFRGKMFAYQRQWEEAARHFARALELDPGLGKARVALDRAAGAGDAGERA